VLLLIVLLSVVVVVVVVLRLEYLVVLEYRTEALRFSLLLLFFVPRKKFWKLLQRKLDFLF
jgi:hypothetical protein